MFEEQRNWLQRFHRSEVKATVVEAAPAKPAVVPQGAQWAGIQKKPATGLPPGWTPIDLPADFAEVFGYADVKENDFAEDGGWRMEDRDTRSSIIDPRPA